MNQVHIFPPCLPNFPSCLTRLSGLSSLGYPSKFFMHFSTLLYVLHAPVISSSLILSPDNILGSFQFTQRLIMQCSQPPATSSLLGSNILLSTVLICNLRGVKMSCIKFLMRGSSYENMVTWYKLYVTFTYISFLTNIFRYGS
jgi:hypothetical protein